MKENSMPQMVLLASFIPPTRPTGDNFHKHPQDKHWVQDNWLDIEVYTKESSMP